MGKKKQDSKSNDIQEQEKLFEKEAIEEQDVVKEENVLVENVEPEVIQKPEDANRRVGNITVEKKKDRSGLNKGLVISAIILVLIALILGGFVLINKLNNNVYRNVYLSGVDLSGKTETELIEYLKQLNTNFKAKNLVIKNGDTELMQLSPEDIDMTIDEIATRAQIMKFGRSEDLLKNNMNVLNALFKAQEFEPIYCYSEAKLNSLVAETTDSIEGKVIDDTFVANYAKNILVITKGKSGKTIIATEFKEALIKALKDSDVKEYNVVLEDASPKELDVDVVFAQVAKDAKDAYVDESVTPHVYHKHETGVTFDKEELRQLIAKEENKTEGKVIEFKLTQTKPSVTIQDITKHLYKDTLGKYTSNYVNSDANRASNVVLGAKMLNGTIIMPGETFSFNKVMGDCGLASRGFKAAAVFKAGKVVKEIGGGICQISSTLYIAALYANMSIVSRTNHALPVGYVPASLDATVYYPYTDFKFKNNRNYPVKIVATTTSSRKLQISICGTKEDVEYEIVLTSQKTGSVAPKVQEQKDSSLALGKTKVIQSGAYGYTSVAYKTVKLNGKVISKTLLSEDKYGSTPKIIAVGTKQVNIYGE